MGLQWLGLRARRALLRSIRPRGLARPGAVPGRREYALARAPRARRKAARRRGRDSPRRHARHGRHAAMGGPATVTSLGEGRYRADFELAMGSTWQVEITARIADGEPVRAEGSLTVGTPWPAPRSDRGGASRSRPAHGTATPSHPAEFALSPERMQRIGVTTTLVERKSLAGPRARRRPGRRRRVRARRRLAQGAGWATRSRSRRARRSRSSVARVLFEVYSPDLFAAQQEYVEALRSQARRARHLRPGPRRRPRPGLAQSPAALGRRAARDRAAHRESLEAKESIPIRAPITGYVVEKNLVEGGAFEPGARLYRIAPLRRSGSRPRSTKPSSGAWASAGARR